MITFNLLVGTIVPALAILFVCILGIVNAYTRIRKRFPARVNCWFCNHNTSVPYDDRNSWFCPSCTQYNGFTEDGDYNREIPAQFQYKLNGAHTNNITDDDKISCYSVGARSTRQPNRNGLCFGCNRNQELKIHQLASFVPEVEENYDDEVEEYRRQLEQAYKLCARCERVLRRTLNDVKRNILGSKLAQIGTRPWMVKYDGKNGLTTGGDDRGRRHKLARACLGMIIVLLAIRISHRLDLSALRTQLEQHASPQVSQTVLKGVSYGIAFVQTLTEQVKQTWSAMFALLVPAKQLGVCSLSELRQWTFVERPAPKVVVLPPNPDHDRELNSKLLLDVAVVGLTLTLAATRSHVNLVKPIAIVFCVLATELLDCPYLIIDEGFHYTGEIALLMIAFGMALCCIGKTAPMLASSDSVNDSFHRIYSSQGEDDEEIDSQENSIFNDSFQHAMNVSGKSLNSSKSFSPTAQRRPNWDTSFASTTVTAKRTSPYLNSSFVGESYNAEPYRSVSRLGLAFPTQPAPHRWSHSLNGLNRSGARLNIPEAEPRNWSRFPLLLEEEDIDRLSIGRRVLSRKDLTLNSSSGNPFAMHHIAASAAIPTTRRPRTPWDVGGYWEETASSSPLKKTTLEKQVPAEWISSAQVYHNQQQQRPPSAGESSSTSSRSSGFESQPSQVNVQQQRQSMTTMEELDCLSVLSEPIARPSVVRPHAVRGSANLFTERSIFQGGLGTPGLANSVIGSIFPPQCSQTPPVFGSMPCLFQQQRHNRVGASTSAASPQTSRRSLLNLSKINELDTGSPGRPKSRSGLML